MERPAEAGRVEYDFEETMWQITSTETLHTAMLPGEVCQGLLACSMCVRQRVYHMCLEEWPVWVWRAAGAIARTKAKL